MSKPQIRVTLRRSGIGRPDAQKIVLKGLGLTRLHKTVVLNDPPPIRGMVRKVVHLVEMEVL
jgi:large subunit ribosomal protein L30